MSEDMHQDEHEEMPLPEKREDNGVRLSSEQQEELIRKIGMPMARIVAANRTKKYRVGGTVLQHDLESEATLAVLKASRSFNPTRIPPEALNAMFWLYAKTAVNRAINAYFQHKEAFMPNLSYRRLKDMKKLPDTPRNRVMIKDFICKRGRRFESFEQRLEDHKSVGFTPSVEAQIITETEEQEVKAILKSVMERRPPREQQILNLLFSGQMTQNEVGEQFGISGERVRQIIQRILREARKNFGISPDLPSQKMVFKTGGKAVDRLARGKDTSGTERGS